MYVRSKKFNSRQLAILGYNPDSVLCHVYFSDSELEDFRRLVYGKFENIIKLIFSSNDGSLDNDFQQYLSENSPDVVKSFVSNILMANVQSLPSAPDSDTAFDMIIPRSVQSRSDLAVYIPHIKQTIDGYLKSSQNVTEQSTSSE